MIFDGAGRRTQLTAQQALWNGNQVTVNQTTGYDGDGLRVYEVASGVTTYYLRSSVLNGTIIEEINSSGQKTVGYVSLPGGQLLATQTPYSSQTVTWKHNTPAGTGEYAVNTYNTATSRVEFDPLGADISLTPPPEPPHSRDEGELGPGYAGGIMGARWSDFFNLDSGFVIDGQSVSSNYAILFINFGTGNSARDTVGMSAEALANAVLLSLGPALFAPAGVSTIRINVSGLEAIPGRQTIEWQWISGVRDINGVVLPPVLGPVPTAYSGTLGSLPSVVDLPNSHLPAQNPGLPRPRALMPHDPDPNASQISFASLIARNVLSASNSCSQFFRGAMAATAALDKLTRVIEPTLFYNRPGLGISTSFNLPYTLETAGGVTLRIPSSALVNTQGIFFYGSTFVGPFTSNSTAGQVLQILHEVAHFIQQPNGNWLIFNDGGSTTISTANTNAVAAHCADAIKSALGVRPVKVNIGAPPPH